MNKHVKGAIIFANGVIGGFILCGAAVSYVAIKSKDVRKLAAEKISNFLLK